MVFDGRQTINPGVEGGQAERISIKPIWPSQEVREELAGPIEAAFSDCRNRPAMESDP